MHGLSHPARLGPVPPPVVVVVLRLPRAVPAAVGAVRGGAVRDGEGERAHGGARGQRSRRARGRRLARLGRGQPSDSGRHRSRDDLRPARGRRPRLAPRARRPRLPAARRTPLPRARGPSSRRGRGSRRLDRSLARAPGLRLERAGRRRAAHRRRLVRAARPRQETDRGPRRAARARRRPLPGQLVPAPAAPSHRGRRLLRRRLGGPLLRALRRGDPPGPLLRDRLRARAGSSPRAARSPGPRRSSATERSAPVTRPPSGAPCACSVCSRPCRRGSSPGCSPCSAASRWSTARSAGTWTRLTRRSRLRRRAKVLSACGGLWPL